MDFDTLDKLDRDWKSPFVARSEIENFTQGRYKSSTFNTYDGARKGIRRQIRLNSKVAYLKKDILEWLKDKRRK